MEKLLEEGMKSLKPAATRRRKSPHRYGGRAAHRHIHHVMARRLMGAPRSPYATAVVPLGPEEEAAAALFDQFCQANTFQTTMACFYQLCDLLQLKPQNHQVFYKQLKIRLNSWKAQSLWSKLDKRASQREYKKATACSNTQVLIIGAGPCGLRSAIEIALLGGKAVVVEKRDRFSRNNVLHLWPFLIHDLKALGAKKFFGKFCASSIDHISIRTLQCILLKVALLVGVEIHAGVSFDGLVEPSPLDDSERVGWRAQVTPADHPVSQFEFDALIGADGKRNTLTGFRRKEFRGKLAIAITANFINRNTQQEARVEEISGVAYIFNQKFFKDLNAKTGIDLENIVYYKDETHYFVMTAKKHSLLNKGVLIRDYEDPEQLLSQSNVDQTALLTYARQAADVSTNNLLPHNDFAHNHYGQPDVAMFDFTSMFAAEHASRTVEKNGYKLLIGLVGDSLLEPFWPTGSGCARGFLGALDAAWMIRNWASGKLTPLEVMGQRESIYQLLSQTTPENLNKNFTQYTIDPNTRYPNCNSNFFKPHQMRRLYDGGTAVSLDEMVNVSEERSKKYDCVRDTHYLLKWFQRQLEPYHKQCKVLDLTSSWRNGLALAALIHKYRPHLIDLYALDPNLVAENNQKVFDLAHKEFGIEPIASGSDMERYEMPEKQVMIEYLQQFYDVFSKEAIKASKLVKPVEEKRMIKSPVQPRRHHHTKSPGLLRQSLGNATKHAARSRPNKGDIDDVFLAENELGRKTNTNGKPLYTYGVATKRIKEMTNPGPEDNGTGKILDARDLEKLRLQKELKAMQAGRRGQVSSLAKHLDIRLVAPQTADPELCQPTAEAKSHGESCFFCGKKVYLVERYTAEGVFFHRGCFRCHYCGAAIRIGGHAYVKDQNGGGKFYCRQHQGLVCPAPKRLRRRSRGSRDLADFVGPATPPSQPPLLESDVVQVKSTPERVEYCTESEMEESELDQTAHNLSASLLDLTSGVDASADSADSSEDDMDWSDGELSDADVSWADLAKSYSRKLRKQEAAEEKATAAESGDGEDADDESGTETETAEEDEDWETETERESDSEYEYNEESSDEITTPTMDAPRVSACERLGLTPPSQPTVKDPQPSPSSAALSRNRLAFFSAVSEPVRIDAHSFLGLRPAPFPHEPEIKVDLVEDDNDKLESDEASVDASGDHESSGVSSKEEVPPGVAAQDMSSSSSEMEEDVSLSEGEEPFLSSMSEGEEKLYNAGLGEALVVEGQEGSLDQWTSGDSDQTDTSDEDLVGDEQHPGTGEPAKTVIGDESETLKDGTIVDKKSTHTSSEDSSAVEEREEEERIRRRLLVGAVTLPGLGIGKELMEEVVREVVQEAVAELQTETQTSGYSNAQTEAVSYEDVVIETESMVEPTLTQAVSFSSPELASAEKESTPSPEPTSTEMENTPLPEPSSTEKESTPSPEPTSAEKESTPSPEPTSAEKESTPSPEPTATEMESTPSPESTSTEMESTPSPEPTSTEKESTPLLEPTSAEKESTPSPEPTSTEMESTPSSEPTSAEKESTPLLEPTSTEMENTPSPEPTSAEKESTPSPEPTSTEMESTPSPEPTSTEMESTPSSEPTSAEKESTPLLESTLTEKENTPSPEPTSTEKESTPSPESTLTEKESTPSPESTLTEKESTPSPEPTLTEKESSPSPEPTLTEKESSPSPEPILTEKESSPSPEPTSAEKEIVPSSEPTPAEKESNPSLEPSSAEEEIPQPLEPTPRAKESTPSPKHTSTEKETVTSTEPTSAEKEIAPLSSATMRRLSSAEMPSSPDTEDHIVDLSSEMPVSPSTTETSSASECSQIDRVVPCRQTSTTMPPRATTESLSDEDNVSMKSPASISGCSNEPGVAGEDAVGGEGGSSGFGEGPLRLDTEHECDEVVAGVATAASVGSGNLSVTEVEDAGEKQEEAVGSSILAKFLRHEYAPVPPALGEASSTSKESAATVDHDKSVDEKTTADVSQRRLLIGAVTLPGLGIGKELMEEVVREVVQEAVAELQTESLLHSGTETKSTLSQDGKGVDVVPVKARQSMDDASMDRDLSLSNLVSENLASQLSFDDLSDLIEDNIGTPRVNGGSESGLSTDNGTTFSVPSGGDDEHRNASQDDATLIKEPVVAPEPSHDSLQKVTRADSKDSQHSDSLERELCSLVSGNISSQTSVDITDMVEANAMDNVIVKSCASSSPLSERPTIESDFAETLPEPAVDDNESEQPAERIHSMDTILSSTPVSSQKADVLTKLPFKLEHLDSFDEDLNMSNLVACNLISQENAGDMSDIVAQNVEFISADDSLFTDSNTARVFVGSAINEQSNQLPVSLLPVSPVSSHTKEVEVGRRLCGRNVEAERDQSEALKRIDALLSDPHRLIVSQDTDADAATSEVVIKDEDILNELLAASKPAVTKTSPVPSSKGESVLSNNDGLISSQSENTLTASIGESIIENDQGVSEKGLDICDVDVECEEVEGNDSKFVEYSFMDECGNHSFVVDEKYVSTRKKKPKKAAPADDTFSIPVSMPTRSLDSDCLVTDLTSSSLMATLSLTEEGVSVTNEPSTTSVASVSVDKQESSTGDSLDDLVAANASLDDDAKSGDVAVKLDSPQISVTELSNMTCPGESTTMQSANNTMSNGSVYSTTPSAPPIEHKNHSHNSTLSAVSAANEPSDRRSVGSVKSDSSMESGQVYSPHHLVDAKRRFFFETAQPVRIDPSNVFKSLGRPKKMVAKEVSESEFTNSIVGHEQNGVFDTGKGDAPTAAVPRSNSASGDSELFSALSDGDFKKPGEVKKRQLPVTPAEHSKVDLSKKTLTAAEIKLIKSVEQTKMKKDVRERARLMSDEDLGVNANVMPLKVSLKSKDKKSKTDGVLRDKKNNSTDRPKSTSSSSSSAVSSNKSSPSIIPHAMLSDGSASDASPSTGRKSKKVSKGKSKMEKSKDKSEKENSESTAVSGEEKRDKRRSLFSMLLSKSQERKEKRAKSPPPPEVIRAKSPTFFSSKSPPTDPKMSTKSPEQGRPASAGKRLGVRLRPKSSKAKEAEEKRKSMLDEMSSLQIKTEEQQRARDTMREKLLAVAPSMPKSLTAPKATLEEFDLDDDDKVSLRSFQMQTGLSDDEMARLLKRQQKAAQRRQKEQELKRLRMASEIQRGLEEVEQRQREVEGQGVRIEQQLRQETKASSSQDESCLLQDWFNVVHEKNVLVRYESELMIHAKELELEDRHSRLETRLRDAMSIPEEEKSFEQSEEEQQIMGELLEVVEQRDALVALLDEHRLRSQEADQGLRDIMSAKGYQLSPRPLNMRLRVSSFRSMGTT